MLTLGLAWADILLQFNFLGNECTYLCKVTEVLDVSCCYEVAKLVDNVGFLQYTIIPIINQSPCIATNAFY